MLGSEPIFEPRKRGETHSNPRNRSFSRGFGAKEKGTANDSKLGLARLLFAWALQDLGELRPELQRVLAVRSLKGGGEVEERGG